MAAPRRFESSLSPSPPFHSWSSFLDRFSPPPDSSLLLPLSWIPPSTFLSSLDVPWRSFLLSFPPPLFFLFSPSSSSSPSDKSRGRSWTVLLSIERLSLSLSLFPGFLLLPVVAIYFTSLRRYRKLFAALDPARQTPEGSIVPSRESKNLARSTPTRLFSPMVIYGPLRRARGKKKRYSNDHASSIEFDVYLILFILWSLSRGFTELALGYRRTCR